MKKRSDDEQGMILVNVLMFVAIAAGIVLLLINREELALDRGLRAREAARALAVVRGAELSAIVALRRDAETTEGADHSREPWAQLNENDTPIDGGSFSLTIADAQGRLNINMLRYGDLGAMRLFEKIAKQAGLSAEETANAIGYVRQEGPFADTRPLRDLGLDPTVTTTLESLLTALPARTKVNLNAASREMLVLLFTAPLVGERLFHIREQRGYLTEGDLTSQSVSMPPAASLVSAHFWVRASATIGSTNQQTVSLIQRVPAQSGGFSANPVSRWRGAARPSEAFLLR